MVHFGDFNICFKQKKSVLYRKYEQLLRIFNLKQIINDPTRITENTASVIDHILCSHENKIFQSGVVPIGVSDHFLTFCTRRNVRPKKKINVLFPETSQYFLGSVCGKFFSFWNIF